MTEHYTILTDKGASKIAEAIRIGQKIEITQMALGDGDGKLPQPQSNATSLVKERYRAPINSAKADEHNNAWVIFEQVLAPDIGGWWIREVGLYDKDGDLIAIGNYPEQYKPLLTEGASTTQTVSIVIQVLSSDAITLKVDPSVVLATRQYVDDARSKLAGDIANVDQLLSSMDKSLANIARSGKAEDVIGNWPWARLSDIPDRVKSLNSAAAYGIQGSPTVNDWQYASGKVMEEQAVCGLRDALRYVGSVSSIGLFTYLGGGADIKPQQTVDGSTLCPSSASGNVRDSGRMQGTWICLGKSGVVNQNGGDATCLFCRIK